MSDDLAKLHKRDGKNKHLKGLVALSPLAVFLVTYFLSSLLAGDFYKIPISAAFLIACVYAVFITRGITLSDRINVFSKGAGDSNVLLMIWIFILAGVFASTAKEIGAIDAAVNLTIKLLPGRFLLCGLFLASCFISFAIGTSVGTIVALVPLAIGIGAEAEVPVALITAIIVGGAFFGDNLSFISDTTIAATRTQGCSMSDKFKTNVWIAVPAAVIVSVIYFLQGKGIEVPDINESAQIIKLIPYFSVIALALTGMNVTAVLCIGTALNIVIGFFTGAFTWTHCLGAIGEGIQGMGDLIIVTMLSGGLLALIRHNGGLDYLIRILTKRIKGKRGAEFSIAALVSLTDLCTANNTVAIITNGDIAKDISERFGLDPRKSASILDTFSCIVQCLIPYGAQMLMASGLAQVGATEIMPYLYYPYALAVTSVLAIAIGLPSRASRQGRVSSHS